VERIAQKRGVPIALGKIADPLFCEIVSNEAADSVDHHGFSASRGQREGCECRVEPHLRYSFFDLADWMETLPGPFRI
jgi:hypothetical protein